jgi:hypothetical protein
MNFNSYEKSEIFITSYRQNNTVEPNLSGLIGTASHPDMQKIRIMGVFFENRLHWLFEVWLLLLTVCCV